ncbi:MAG: alpha/beta hydrolase family protein [Oscillospiraceae bacterium]|nr:alpha/beta hydrolase family protein [Oscillospiraceae bacterium]
MAHTTPHEHNIALIKNIAPSFGYNGGEPFVEWQNRALIKLNELLGLPFAKCEESFEIESETKHREFTEIRFSFQSEPGYYVPCHFLVPSKADKPLPLVICLQGHSKGMHKSLGRIKYPGETIDGDRDFAVRALKEGYCALAIEQRCFGECGGLENGDPNCFKSSMAALLIGRTIIGERVWDVQRAIDTIERHFPQADAKKIICMGNSGGGTTTFFAACVEPRINFAMPSCYFCTFDDSIAAMHHCACNYVPKIRNYFDMGDMAGLIAPRPLVIVAGKNDDIFPIHGVEKAFASAHGYYSAAGREDNIKLVIGDGGHRFYADDAWPVMNCFVKE